MEIETSKIRLKKEKKNAHFSYCYSKQKKKITEKMMETLYVPVKISSPSSNSYLKESMLFFTITCWLILSRFRCIGAHITSRLADKHCMFCFANIVVQCVVLHLITFYGYTYETLSGYFISLTQ